MNEHQAEILLSRVTAIAASLDRLCAALEGSPATAKKEALEKTTNVAAAPIRRHQENVATRDAEAQKEEKERDSGKKVEGLSFDDMSMKLASFSRDLPHGVFSKFMKKSILPKYADGGGISTIAPESYEDVMAECTEFFESRTEKGGGA